MMSKEHKNKLQIIDKQTLEVVKEIEAPPGQTLAHVEFTKDGRYALASLWEMDGALVVIDMNTLMKSAIETVNSYKEGTSRNAAAQEIFGGAVAYNDSIAKNHGVLLVGV